MRAHGGGSSHVVPMPLTRLRRAAPVSGLHTILVFPGAVAGPLAAGVIFISRDDDAGVLNAQVWDGDAHAVWPAAQ